MSLEGEVPDEAGVRVIRRGRATVGGRHYGLIAVATIHVAVGLHVVAAEHVGSCEKETGEESESGIAFSANPKQATWKRFSHPYERGRRGRHGVAGAAGPSG